MSNEISDQELENIFANVEQAIERQIREENRSFEDAQGLRTWLFVQHDIRLNSLLAEGDIYVDETLTPQLKQKIDLRKNEFFQKLEGQLFK